MNDSQNEEARKKAIFESMAPRRQKQILKRGYEKWNPFAEPKDPVDMRMDRTKRTTQMLIREFLQRPEVGEHGNDYRRGAFELCLGIINKDERYLGMFEFACWYHKLLEEERKRDKES